MYNSHSIYRMKKKAQLNLDTARSVLIILLVIAVLVVSGVLLGNSLKDVSDNIDTLSTSILNETITITDTADGVETTLNRSVYRNMVLSDIVIQNESGGEAVPTSNYTTVGANLRIVSPSAYNNSLVNVTATGTYNGDGAEEIFDNLTTANADFFGNTGTILAILVIVVIISAIALILYVVRRFTDRSGL